MQALADGAGVPWERWPEQASRRDAIRSILRIRRAKRDEAIERYPSRVAGLDEYPSVPLYWFEQNQLYYDSSGLARHLDSIAEGDYRLLPEDPAIRFICCLIDEAFDEYGLYMAHHNRWVTSAKTNRMGENSAKALFGKILPTFAQTYMARQLSIRQSGRCPYLFSVAPEGFDAGVAPEITPPSIGGFPETHTLLDTSWRRYLAGMERVLSEQPYLLGDQFTLADASAYGQLNMHCIDGRADEIIAEVAPTTHAWLQRITRGEHRADRGDLYLSEHLTDLLAIISETFIPLMRQNEKAYEAFREQGQSRFNQSAWDRGEALYEGEVLGLPFRSVAKTFQVVCWRELLEQWRSLDHAVRSEILSHYPLLEPFDEPAV